MDELKKKEHAVLSKKWKEADDLIFKFLLAYGVAAVGLSFVYSTWVIALAVSAITIGGFMAIRKLAGDTHLHRYFASLAFGVFMALFIYQMHGLFEMHFFAFIGSAIMIAYQQWRMQIPITLFVVLHHGILAYLQYTGVNGIYFTQLEYMSISTFAIHIVLAAVIFSICGLWAYRFKNYSISDAIQAEKLATFNKELANNNVTLNRTKKALAKANSSLQEEKDKLIELTAKQAEINRQLIVMSENN